jgi:hypothetical protein
MFVNFKNSRGPQLMVPLGGDGTFSNLGLVGGRYVIGDMPLKIILEPYLLCFLCFLAVMRWTALLCHVLPAMMLCLATGPKTTKLTDNGLKPVKALVKIKLSSVSKLIFSCIWSQCQKAAWHTSSMEACKRIFYKMGQDSSQKSVAS